MIGKGPPARRDLGLLQLDRAAFVVNNSCRGPIRQAKRNFEMYYAAWWSCESINSAQRSEYSVGHGIVVESPWVARHPSFPLP